MPDISMMLAATLFAAAASTAAESDDAQLARAIRASHVRTGTSRAVVWTPASWSAAASSEVATKLDRTVRDVEEFLGRKQSARVEYLIVGEGVPSHVFGGYRHSDGDPDLVFLAGIETGDAPHIHETTHIVAGEFGSLLLREGLATHVQFALAPGPMRPLAKFGGARDRSTLDAALGKVLGDPDKRAKAEAWIDNPAKVVAFKSRKERTLFYAVAASFTSFVIDEVGVSRFLDLYDERDVKTAARRATGKSWAAFQREWLAYISKGE